ncbi:hypothetical protein PN36_02720 [Candidatus Thiomargarita nelsonii]|uniref:Class I SAM-dependent methyltransferase n=1 Tax=Candidatus Thiomargarita nelsonii TaxID=1003181 RepID=A0A0A6PE69_9GAMM|nr:hypothetical protein PN36_02720 [Candidatus Thiomargarita nelsonii]
MIKKLIDKVVWRLFPFFEKFGFHVLPVHYYSPIPDTRQLKKNIDLLAKEHPLYGIDMREKEQLEILYNVLKPIENEYKKWGGNSFGLTETEMPSFAPINALALYAFIRHFKPKKMIEVGSGMSTKISATAFNKNEQEGHAGQFIAIEPYPSKELQKGYDGLSRLDTRKVENVELEMFKELGSNDILFIDSSHTVKVLGDVNYLYLNVIPQLNPGVIIHIHDIFFPVEYLPHHFLKKGLKQFWQEQYLLHAFLMFNQEFEVLSSLSYLHCKFQNELKVLFPWYHVNRWPSSFWMRRKRTE